MKKITLKKNNHPFEALLLESDHATRKIIFAAGSGGNPERHLPLLETLAQNGCAVLAPYFERIATPMPQEQELLDRADSLLAAIDFLADSNTPITGIGHSIGATLLVSIAGAKMWMRSGQCLAIREDMRLKKLVLLTPPTGFFQAPKSLDNVQTPMQIWGGTLDTITPPEQIELLRENLPKNVSLDIRLIEGAGHFSFMNTLPPHIVDTMKNREEFLSELANELSSQG